MKLLMAVVILAGSVTLGADTLPAITVACGEERTVYVNTSAAAPVVVQVFAKCSQGASIGVFTKGRTPPVKKFDISAGQIQTVRVSVETDGAVKINFKGVSRGAEKEAKYILAIP